MRDYLFKQTLRISFLMILVLSYLTIKQQAYIVDSSYYFEYLEAEANRDKDSQRLHLCRLIWDLRNKGHKIQMFLMCHDTLTDLVNELNGKKSNRFDSLDDADRINHEQQNAKFKYEYFREHRIKAAFLSLFNKTLKPKTLDYDYTYNKICKYHGEYIETYHRYEYGYWTSEGQIMIPDAYEITDCEEVKP